MVVKTLNQYGGVERHVQQVTAELTKRGYEVSVLIGNGSVAFLVEAEIRCMHAVHPWEGWRWVVRHQMWLDQFDVIVIHDFYPAVFWLFPYLVRRLRQPVVLVRHGHEGQWPVPAPTRNLHWLAYDLATASIAVGEWISEVYGPPADMVTYGGVVQQRNTDGPGAYRILFAGRLEPDTDVHMLLEALSILRARYGVELPADLYGNGSLRPRLETYARRRGLPVRFFASVPDPAVLMSGYRFVYATGYLSIWEALAAGRIVFAAYSSELKRRYLSCMPPFLLGVARLYSTSDDLAEGLKEALENPEYFWHIARQGYKLTRQHTWGAIADAYETLFRYGERRTPSKPGLWGVWDMVAHLSAKGLPVAQALLMADELADAETGHAHVARAALFQIADFPDRALCELEKARRQLGDIAPILYHRGELLYRVGDYQAALEVLQVARRLEPDNSQIAYMHAVVSEALGIPEARAEYEACIRLDPSHVYAHMRLGMLQVRSGEEGGIRHLEEAVRLAPEVREATVQLAQALARFGRCRECLAVLERANARSWADPRVNELYCKYGSDGRSESTRGQSGTAMRKVSVVLTIKNEESSIAEVLEALLSQSRPPDEIVVVDGGSTDRTVEIVRQFARDHDTIRLIEAPGTNIAQGRNIGIRAATHNLIAVTDAGCRADRDWLRNIVAPFEVDSEVQVVCGFYKPDCRSLFERILGELTFPKLECVDPNTFMPSSRSIAFTRDAWEMVGGYPEYLQTAEDTLFDLSLRKAGLKHAFASDAIVYWRPRPNLRAFYRQSFAYARGDGEARLFFIWNQQSYLRLFLLLLVLTLLVVSPLVGALLALVGALGFLMRAWGVYQAIHDWRVFLWLPLIWLALDVGRVYGYTLGWLRVGRKKPPLDFDSPFLTRINLIRWVIGVGRGTVTEVLRLLAKPTAYILRTQILLFVTFSAAVPALYFRSQILGGVAAAACVVDYFLRRVQAVYRARYGRRCELGFLRNPNYKPVFSSGEPFVEDVLATWAPESRWLYDLRYEELADTLISKAAPGARVLDVGCGDGYLLTKVVRKRPDLRVLGIDHNPYRVKLARRRGLEAILVDAEFMPFGSAEFDIVVSTYTLGQTIRPHIALYEATRVLVPGGKLVLAVPSRHSLPWSWNPLSMLEVLLGTIVPGVLSPHHHLVNWQKDHSLDRRYTVAEVVRFLREYQYEVIRIETLVLPFTRWLTCFLVKVGQNPEKAARKAVRVERILRKLPIFNRLGETILAIARKSCYSPV
ncbi:glycosyltransferase [Desulfofundulus sp. TPOSR]|uniref:glycosyltransferase n=1 Tax=Desulfofundulus sp. TPOSR TaxID=2714340 RepID=UPI001407A3C2|nr:glycosyltransferase [Desulfofundulus sp. TPOSR]NHM28242.1 glycosyltransferase [Desulfofundulus sp. TPOSR]